MDKNSLVEYVLFGVGKAAIGPFMPSFSWANDKLAPYDYDVEKARDLLAQAGWKDNGGDGLVDKDGKPLELSLFTWPQRPGQPPMAEALASQMKEIGIKVNVDVIDYSVIDERQSRGEWDMVLDSFLFFFVRL